MLGAAGHNVIREICCPGEVPVLAPTHLPILHSLVNQALHHVTGMHIHCAQRDEPFAIVLAERPVDQLNQITGHRATRGGKCQAGTLSGGRAQVSQGTPAASPQLCLLALQHSLERVIIAILQLLECLIDLHVWRCGTGIPMQST